MAGWPDKQSHALLIMVPRADRIYEGLDLSVLGKDFAPDVLVDAERAEADGVHMPEPGFYGSYFLPKGQVSPMLGQPVALGIWHDYERYREAVRLLRFNDGIFRWGAAATPPSASPMWPRAMCAWEPTGMTSPICTRRCTTASCARS
jgi:hypothetical protein